MPLQAQSAVGHQIDGVSQHVFDIELRAEVAFGGRAPVQANEDVGITVLAHPIACEGTKQGGRRCRRQTILEFGR